MLLLAQTTRPQAHFLTLLEGRGELLTFERNVTKVAISEPKIADAVVISPREVMVNAKGLGRATLVVWETDADPVRWEIQVAKDNSEWDSFVKSFSDSAGAPISVTGTGDTIVLSGRVKSMDDSRRLAGMAQTRAKTVINLLQAPDPPEPRQILLQVKFAAIDRTALTQIGFNLFSLNDKMIGAITTQQFPAGRFSPLQVQGGESVGGNTVNFSDLLNLFAFRPDLNIGVTIKALQQRNLLQMLAEPNLIAVEGKEASFLAGGQFPYPTITSTPTGGGTAPVVTIQFKPFGVKLDFLPTITANGAIDLKVAPEVSSLDYANSLTLQGFLIPALSQRRAETEVILKDGESFAIAGLIDNRVVETLSKVPGLGDVPILGKIFRSRSTQKSTDELLVVVTPHFVRPLTPGEKVTLPEMPTTFLPTVVEEKRKKGKAVTNTKSSSKEPEFVGPRGQQIPK